MLTAYYDLAIGPVSFDFVVFLIKAKLAAKDGLHVVIVPMKNGVGGMFRDKTHLYDEHEMHWRLWNICIPACQLINATVTLATDWDQARKLKTDSVFPEDWDRQTLKDRRHLIGGVITASRAGSPISLLSASAQARSKVSEFYAGRKVVTMTLRSTYLEQRNSDRDAWSEAKAFIEKAGYTVVVLEDTGVALSKGQGFGEFNLDIRMAMYQEAVLNLQANNGAASLCWFSEKPYRMFGAGVPEDEWNGLFVKQGLPLGETWPWAKHEQKIVYHPATAQKIIEEFRSWDGATS